MKKKVLILLGVSVAILLFTGCAPKIPPTSATTVNYKDGQPAKGIWAKSPERPMFTTSATYLNTVIAHTLQISAEESLKSGNSYFYILEPQEIATANNPMLNAAKEFVEKCANNSILKSLVVLTNPCRIASGDLAAPKGGKMTIRDVEKQSNDFVTYNAQEILSYLKSSELYKARAVE